MPVALRLAHDPRCHERGEIVYEETPVVPAHDETGYLCRRRLDLATYDSQMFVTLGLRRGDQLLPFCGDLHPQVLEGVDNLYAFEFFEPFEGARVVDHFCFRLVQPESFCREFLQCFGELPCFLLGVA